MENEKRIFYYIIENIFETTDPETTVVVGEVCGAVRSGEEVRVLDSTGASHSTVITGLEVKDGDNFLQPDEFINGTVALKLNCTKDKLSKYAVITNLLESDIMDGITGTENPLVVGMSFNKSAYSADPEFHDKFFRALQGGKYLLAVTHLPKADDPTSPVPDTMGTVSIDDPSEAGKSIMVFFTSMRIAKQKHRELNATGLLISFTLATFEQVTELISADIYSGFVIDPWTMSEIFMPKQLVNDILSEIND